LVKRHPVLGVLRCWGWTCWAVQGALQQRQRDGEQR
jgi:hypothetical protein